MKKPKDRFGHDKPKKYLEVMQLSLKAFKKPPDLALFKMGK